MRLFLLLLMVCVQFVYGDDKRSREVIVSVAPYKFFVESIAGDSVKVDVLVPPGASFHHYEPTPGQVIKAAKADIWFRIGESFEGRALQAITSHHPEIKIVDLRDGVNLIVVDHAHHHHEACCHGEGGADLHIWLSLRQSKIQAKKIAEALIAVYPEHKKEFEERLDLLLGKMERLDQEIITLLKPLKTRVMMVGHPAYAYFARDYDLRQIPVELEGKDPSAKQLTLLLHTARELKIKTIFVQPQYNNKGPALIAKEIGAELIVLDPYSGDYFQTLREIARKISLANHSL